MRVVRETDRVNNNDRGSTLPLPRTDGEEANSPENRQHVSSSRRRLPRRFVRVRPTVADRAAVLPLICAGAAEMTDAVDSENRVGRTPPGGSK